MAPHAQFRRLATTHGFLEHPAPGFIGFHRIHPDGRSQSLNVFWWQNAKHAAAAGIPRYYMVLDVSIGSLTHGAGATGRFRLPMVTWPAAPSSQLVRPWTDVAAELEEVFLPLYDLPEAEGSRRLRRLDDRYQIKRPSDAASGAATNLVEHHT